MSDKCRILYKSSTSGAKSHSRPGRSTLVLGVGCMADECQISVNTSICIRYVSHTLQIPEHRCCLDSRFVRPPLAIFTIVKIDVRYIFGE